MVDHLGELEHQLAQLEHMVAFLLECQLEEHNYTAADKTIAIQQKVYPMVEDHHNAVRSNCRICALERGDKAAD